MSIIKRIKSIFTDSPKGALSMLFGATKSGRIILNPESQLETYQTSAYVYAAVNKRAEKVGQIEFELFLRAKNGQVGKKVETKNPFLDVLYKPNKYQTKNEFFALYQTYKDLVGRAFIYVIRDTDGETPMELHLLRPDWVKPVCDATGAIVRFDYRVEGRVDQMKEIKPEDMIFSAYPSPLTRFDGLSPLVPGALSIDTEEQLALYHNNVIKNGGRVEGILKTGQEQIGQDQIDDIREQWEKDFAGAKKSGKPLVLTGGLEYENIGLNPTELSFIESKKMTRDDILLLFGVPKVLVAQTEDVNFATAREAHKIFLQETVKPLLDNLVQKLNEFYVSDQYELQYVDPTPQDQEQTLRRVESGVNFGYMTINEGREIAGLDPIDGGDTLLVGMGKVPLAFVVEEPEPAPVSPTPPPPQPAPEPEKKPDGEGEGTDQKTNKGAKKKSEEFVHPLRNKAVRDIYRKQAAVKQAKNERIFLRQFRKYANEQKKRVIEYLDSAPKGFKKDIIDDAFNLSVEVDLAKDILKPLLEQMALDSGNETVGLVGDAAVTFTYSDKIKATIDKRATFFTREINKTTFDALKEAFATSVQEGESRPQLIKRIERVYDGYTKQRARTIARTETHVAVQEGVMEGYRQTSIPIKIWVAVTDSATRDTHLEIDGEEKPTDASFSNGLMYPGDPAGDAAETVNCRCSI